MEYQRWDLIQIREEVFSLVSKGMKSKGKKSQGEDDSSKGVK